jgi:serine/threonine-protein kinase
VDDGAVGIVAILSTFGFPTMALWLRYRYKALERGLTAAAPPPLVEAVARERKLLEERVRNLESIVCSVDSELHRRIEQLSARAAGLPPAPAARMVETANAAFSLPSGHVVAHRYRVERELGRGGMGTVYLAHDAQLGEAVALKVMSTRGLLDDVQGMERFRREASAARKVTHENVIRIHDVGEDSALGILFLSMEYFAGRPLGSLLQERGALPVDEARRILAAVGAGLTAAHEAGVIHRDLQPSNVLLHPSGAVKLIDFGLAKAPLLAGLTMTGLILGTPEYMAPEQVRGRVVDERSDVYAFGCMAYHMITGRPPFRAETPIAVGFAHCTEVPVPPRELRPELPPALSDAIVQALAKDPAARPRSVAELCRALGA